MNIQTNEQTPECLLEKAREITVVEVKTRRQQRDFLQFPLRLYRDNPCFVPPLYADEKKIFRADYVYHDTCKAIFFNAYRNGIMCGRISGILQRAANEKNRERRIRFTRFDCIDDQNVADALFAALEKWALAEGMDTVCGPLGYSDLEREGLLVEGFDEVSTFEEQYNASYYADLIEHCGYRKEVDWLECKLYAPEENDGKLAEMADFIMKRYHLHFGEAKNVNDFIRRYGDAFFDLLDLSYADLYGTVPFTDGMKKMLISNFRLIVDLKNVAVILDENDRVVCLGLCFPSLAEALQKSQGHLTPAALLRLLRAMRHPRVMDLGLVAVAPEYTNRGVITVFIAHLMKILSDGEIEYCETNLNLEDNYSIRNCWKRFRAVNHKRRRSYVKELSAK